MGSALVFASLLLLIVLADGPQLALVLFRGQLAFGTFLLVVAFALQRRQRWARITALVLLRLGSGSVVAWFVYTGLDLAGSSTMSKAFLPLALILAAFWLHVFHKGVQYLNEPALLAEFDRRGK